MTIRVLLADDQDLVRAGFRMILETQADIEVAGEAGDRTEAVAATLRLQPDVVLVDIRMPNLDGLQATKQIVAAGSGSRVGILTTFDLAEYVYQTLAAGASGFLLKNAPPEQLIRAVRVVAAGDALLARRSPAGSSSRSPASHLPAAPMPLWGSQPGAGRL
jgi:DNA-binding NarL/FixJ family response regulator